MEGPQGASMGIPHRSGNETKGPGPEGKRGLQAPFSCSAEDQASSAASAALNVTLGRMIAVTFSRSGK
jgi:hypothetical protein